MFRFALSDHRDKITSIRAIDMKVEVKTFLHELLFQSVDFCQVINCTLFSRANDSNHREDRYLIFKTICKLFSQFWDTNSGIQININPFSCLFS